MSIISYPTLESNSENQLKFFFLSTGNESIIKAIEYTYIQDMGSRKIYNLAFGDYDIEEGKIIDLAHSNNGDVYKVFNTVLNTIPKFFANYGSDIMMVQGSDSRSEFVENCKLTCKKKCTEITGCKNKDRRINVYRKYVNSNYETLSNEYQFFGGIKVDGVIKTESYVPGKKYNAVFVIKK